MTKPFTIHLGDCLEALRGMPDASIDSIVTDPPYGLAFMGKRWDYDVPSVDVWAECLRVLKPGGHLLAFAGTRTQHRMAVRIEDAGFEIRDMIAWVYGSGFPKSLDVSKAIDKAAGAEREVVGSKLGQPGYSMKQNDTDEHRRKAYGKFTGAEAECAITAPATEAARQWQGWGTALKPALEPITVARKPLAGTVAANVLAHGTGALNIDGCRVGDEVRHAAYTSFAACHGNQLGAPGTAEARRGTQGEVKEYVGRWPANLIHDGSDEVLAGFPDSNGSGPARKLNRGAGNRAGDWGMNAKEPDVAALRDAGTGSAARFFYCAKASRADRNEGLPSGDKPAVATGATMREREDADWPARNGNPHPTVKPTDLMAYLCRLVTPPGGVVLDPFMGSGSTGKAAVREGFRFVGCELDPDYLRIAEARIAHELAKIEAAARAAGAPVPPQLDLFAAA